MLDALLDLFLAVGLTAPAVDLRPAGDARLDAVAREIAGDRLVIEPVLGLGVHRVGARADERTTVNHTMLVKLPADAVRSELDLSRSVIEAALTVQPQHLSYPFGDPTSAGPREFEIASELGFKTAVTTQPGVLFRGHRKILTALPRISLNGEYQRLRYVRVLLSGSATAMWNSLRGLEAA